MARNFLSIRFGYLYSVERIWLCTILDVSVCVFDATASSALVVFSSSRKQTSYDMEEIE